MDNIIEEIKNTSLLGIGRASDMLCICLGEWMPNTTTPWNLSTIEFHIQCPWRIMDQISKRILLASSDIYYPLHEEDDGADFEWDVRGNNAFDLTIENFFPGSEKVFIENVFIDQNCDLQLFFSNGMMFETCICTSVKYAECWRVFSREGDRKHLVAYPNGFLCMD